MFTEKMGLVGLQQVNLDLVEQDLGVVIKLLSRKLEEAEVLLSAELP
jgi:hypothetical protein